MHGAIMTAMLKFWQVLLIIKGSNPLISYNQAWKVLDDSKFGEILYLLNEK